MGLMSMFPGGGGTNNQPLKAPTNLKAEMNTTTSVQITWTDPENEYSQPSGVLIGEWMFTRIVRKAGSPPVNANDGELIVESAVKNQYQTNAFVDSNNIMSGTTYYYAAFAFTTSRVSSPAATYSIVATWYDPVLNNNTWTMINQAFVEGVASDLWQKGDTKTDANGSTFTLELLYPNASQFKLSDGSQPYAIFLLNKATGSTQYGDEDTDYANSTLKRVIANRYNALSDELKSFIHPMDFSLCYGTGSTWGAPDTTKVYSEPTWPLGLKYYKKLFTTIQSMSAKVNGSSTTSHTAGFYMGDCYSYRRYATSQYITDYAAVAFYYNVAKQEWELNEIHHQHSDLQVLYGFAFGKVGA